MKKRVGELLVGNYFILQGKIMYTSSYRDDFTTYCTGPSSSTRGIHVRNDEIVEDLGCFISDEVMRWVTV